MSNVIQFCRINVVDVVDENDHVMTSMFVHPDQIRLVKSYNERNILNRSTIVAYKSLGIKSTITLSASGGEIGYYTYHSDQSVEEVAVKINDCFRH
jgi:hypothetical protein